MGLTPELLGEGWLWLMDGILLGVVVFALWSADWAQLAVERLYQHTVFASVILLVLLWCVRAGLSPGLSIHVLGLTAVTLAVGWAFAMLGGVVALLIMALIGREPWSAIGLDGVVTVILPVVVTYGIVLWERRCGFRLFFAYLFFCGYFGAAIAAAVSGTVMVAILGLAGVYDWHTLYTEYLRYMPLFVIPEAFVNGVVVASLMVFHPQRLVTLEESRYL